MKTIADDPLTILAGGFALGLLAAFVLPMTPVERERLGPTRDRLLENLHGRAAEAIEYGKRVVREAVLGA